MQDKQAGLMNKYGAMIIIGSLFFIFGFITWTNSVLIPYFKLICELSIQEAMLVAFAFYISYFLMAFPSSFILKKTGYKNGMILGLLIMAVGALIFLPAANSRSYIIFLLGLFVQATGLTLLQTAANPYVIILGPIESAASRMSIMGVCNKTAGAIAPLLLIGAIVHNPDEIDQIQKQLLTSTLNQKGIILDELSARLLIPYILIASLLAVLALMIKWTKLPNLHDENAEEKGAINSTAGLFSHTHLILGAIAIFFAVGVEVLVVDSIINYAQYMGSTFRHAKFFATYTLIIMISSYIIGIFIIPKIISQRVALIICSLLGIILTATVLFISNISSLWFLSSLGLCNALLWPAIWPLSLNGLGKNTSKGSALLIMGVVGGAIIPLVYGLLSHMTNPHMGYMILIPSYLFLLYFAVSGYKAGLK